MPTITLPSGLKGEIRHLTIKDGRWLTDKQLQRQGKIIDRILSECWVSTTDNGIYEFNGQPQWGKVLIGDRDFALLAMRHESWGVFEIKIKCGDCGERFVWDLNLADMLEEQGRMLSKESKEAFTNNTPFTATVELDEPREITFKLATGDDARKRIEEKRKAKRSKKKREAKDENALVDAVVVRLISVAGVASEELDDYLESLPMRCLQAFIAAFDERDCGVDTTIEYECPECGEAEEMDLPFDQGFFFPKLRR